MPAIVSDTTVTQPDGTVIETITYDDGTVAVRNTPPPGSAAANAQTLQSRAQAALTANSNDTSQDANIISQAATITATTGTLTTTQLSTYVRQLAQAVSVLAANDQNSKKELNALIRLVLGLLDSTAGT